MIKKTVTNLAGRIKEKKNQKIHIYGKRSSAT